MNEQDEIRLRHMLDAAREVVAFAQDHTREDLDDNKMLIRALSMSIGIIGEASNGSSRAVHICYPVTTAQYSRAEMNAILGLELNAVGWNTVFRIFTAIAPQE